MVSSFSHWDRTPALCLHTEETDRPKVGVADSCPLKAGPIAVLNHVVRGLGVARIGVQAFVFLLSVRKKKLATARIGVLSGIVHTSRDAMLRRTRNQRGLSTTFVKNPSSSILAYCPPKPGLLWRLHHCRPFGLIYCIIPRRSRSSKDDHKMVKG